MKTVTYTWMGLLALLIACISPASAQEPERILMLVTGADEMTNGKPTGLWLEEFAVPYLAFVEAGYDVHVATVEGGAAPVDPRSKPTPEQAAAWKEASQRLADTKPLSAFKADDHAAIFIPGGHGVMFDLATSPAAIAMIEAFAAQDKPIAAVCHGPAALVGVKGKDGKPLVAGKRVAAFTNAEERAVELEKDMPFLLETRLRELGATVETGDNFKANAVRDGNLITGQNPGSSHATAKLLLDALSNAE